MAPLPFNISVRDMKYIMQHRIIGIPGPAFDIEMIINKELSDTFTYYIA